eukprot:SAG11_NODE_3225_length_2599_cov_17.320400_3_plen_88_part_01
MARGLSGGAGGAARRRRAARQVLGSLDVNGDGHIDYEDFVRWWAAQEGAAMDAGLQEGDLLSAAQPEGCALVQISPDPAGKAGARRRR